MQAREAKLVDYIYRNICILFFFFSLLFIIRFEYFFGLFYTS
jgi:hypothetical protein